jgi:hypothetical protein
MNRSPDKTLLEDLPRKGFDKRRMSGMGSVSGVKKLNRGSSVKFDRQSQTTMSELQPATTTDGLEM